MLNPQITTIAQQARDGALLSAGEIATLFAVPVGSPESAYLQSVSRAMTQQTGPAEVHAQVGLNIAPCPKNCLFCSFAATNQVFAESHERSLDDVVADCQTFERDGANAVYLMATAQYPIERFAKVGAAVRRDLQPATVLIANVGDFDRDGARLLKDAGFTGIYHAIRLGEGTDTRIPPETRFQTFKAALDEGLIIGTCVEPVGSEHTIDELVEKTLMTRTLDAAYSGTARRIPIPDTPLARYPIVSEFRMAHYLAVVRLAIGTAVPGNCTHEPNVIGAAAGANLFWAEVGANPRDTEAETARHRGLTVADCRRLFAEAELPVLEGPSRFYTKAGHRVATPEGV
ncbi:MAG: radical SAM protein [Armatimonadota bacterium]